MGDFLNLKDAFYEGVGEYGVPELARVTECDIEQWKTFIISVLNLLSESGYTTIPLLLL